MSQTNMVNGILFSIFASIIFGVLYLYSPLLTMLNTQQVFGWRIVFTLPFVLIFAYYIGDLGLLKQLWQRIKQQPSTIFILMLTSLLCSVQLWLFMWGPLNGRGLHVSLGYFLLPLVMVLIGAIALNEKLSKFQQIAVLFATVGVLHEIWRVGSISWETALVALGYSAYFWLRTKTQLNHLGGFISDLILALPIACYFILTSEVSAYLQDMVFVGSLLGFGILSALGLGSYILASRYLSFSLFGLLSYLEPILLACASFMLGESITTDEWLTYIPIWLAVLMLALESVVKLKKRPTTSIDQTTK